MLMNLCNCVEIILVLSMREAGAIIGESTSNDGDPLQTKQGKIN